MIILGIDTSCDETSVSLLEDDKVIVQKISSQIASQAKWGGVVPMLAKRQHTERVEYIMSEALSIGFSRLGKKSIQLSEISKDLKQELGRVGENEESYRDDKKIGEIKLHKKQKSYDSTSPEKVGDVELKRLVGLENPGIDLIAVTVGPGLAPALQVGLKAAWQLAQAWNVKLTPVNHMEGHFWSGLLKNSAGKNKYGEVNYPLMGLLVSGGHTELVLSEKYGEYEIIGQTLDDAAGEAFDKFAVMLGLGYPGGPTVEEFAKKALKKYSIKEIRKEFPLPIPMQQSDNLDFSFSGLKTAAMYMLREKGGVIDASRLKPDEPERNISMSPDDVYKFCASFQYSVVTAIENKLRKALDKHSVKMLMTGGGVVANNTLRNSLRKIASEKGLKVALPEKRFLVDNGSMIGLVGYYNSIFDRNIYSVDQIKTDLDIIDRKPGLEI